MASKINHNTTPLKRGDYPPPPPPPPSINHNTTHLQRGNYPLPPPPPPPEDIEFNTVKEDEHSYRPNSDIKQSGNLLSVEVKRLVDSYLAEAKESKNFSTGYIHSMLWDMKKGWHEDFLSELIRQVRTGEIEKEEIQPIEPQELLETYEKLLNDLNGLNKRKTVKKLVYVVDDNKKEFDKKHKKHWESGGYSIHYSGEKTLYGKYIKHMYIYAHGGLRDGPVDGKAAIKAKKNRFNGKQFAQLLRSDGFLMDEENDADPFFISKEQRPLITVLACGAGISPGNDKVDAYLKAYDIVQKREKSENGKTSYDTKLGFWSNNYMRLYSKDSEGLMLPTTEVKPFVVDFWEAMKLLNLNYEKLIKRVHAFKAIMVLDEKSDDFGIMTFGLKHAGSQMENIDIDLDSDRITQKQKNDASNGEFLVVLPKLDEESSEDAAALQNFRGPITSNSARRRMMTNNGIRRHFPYSNTTRGRRMINNNGIRNRYHRTPTSNTVRGVRMITEIQNKIRNEELNSGITHSVNDEFWC